MSLACSNLFGKNVEKRPLKGFMYREKCMKIGTEERGIVCKHVEWPLPSLPVAQGSMPG